MIGTSSRPDWQLAVVIGAGGMGMAAARRLSQRYRILIADLDARRALAAAETLCSEGGDAVGLACDVTNPVSVAGLTQIVADKGGFRVLVHVAGLSPSMGDFSAIINVNLSGVALVAETLLPFASQGTAAILISSMAGHNFRPSGNLDTLLGSPRHPELVQKLKAEIGPEAATPPFAYQLSKYGMIVYCRRQARAWGERGARIISLSPGMIATPMGAIEFEKSPQKRQLYSNTPLKREGTMLEIADAIEFLASDKASFISGTDLLVDGGLAGTLAG